MIKSRYNGSWLKAMGLWETYDIVFKYYNDTIYTDKMKYYKGRLYGMTVKLMMSDVRNNDD